MKLSRALLLISMATPLFAQTSTWDTSGNGMLNGQYYFRHVLYVLSSTGDGSLYDALSLYGTVTFNGSTPGTYSIAPRSGSTASATPSASGTPRISAPNFGACRSEERRV